jgi:hypothetical protein
MGYRDSPVVRGAGAHDVACRKVGGGAVHVCLVGDVPPSAWRIC